MTEVMCECGHPADEHLDDGPCGVGGYMRMGDGGVLTKVPPCPCQLPYAGVLDTENARLTQELAFEQSFTLVLTDALEHRNKEVAALKDAVKVLQTVALKLEGALEDIASMPTPTAETTMAGDALRWLSTPASEGRETP